MAEGGIFCDLDAEKSFRVSGLVAWEAGRRQDVTDGMWMCGRACIGFLNDTRR